MQLKIHNIMKDAKLEELAQRTFDAIAGEVADYADAIAIARCKEKGVEEHDSADAIKIYNAAESTIIAAVLDHMKKINNKI